MTQHAKARHRLTRELLACKPVYCRLEALPYAHTKMIVLVNYAAIFLGLVGIVAVMVLKFKAEGIEFLMNNDLPLANLCILSFLLAITLIGIAILGYHIHTTWHCQWDGLRWRVVASNMVLLLLMLVVSTSSMVLNATVVSASICWWLPPSEMSITVSKYIMNLAWVTVWAVMVYQAQLLCPSKTFVKTVAHASNALSACCRCNMASCLCCTATSASAVAQEEGRADHVTTVVSSVCCDACGSRVGNAEATSTAVCCKGTAAAQPEAAQAHSTTACLQGPDDSKWGTEGMSMVQQQIDVESLSDTKGGPVDLDVMSNARACSTGTVDKDDMCPPTSHTKGSSAATDATTGNVPVLMPVLERSKAVHARRSSHLENTKQLPPAVVESWQCWAVRHCHILLLWLVIWGCMTGLFIYIVVTEINADYSVGATLQSAADAYANLIDTFGVHTQQIWQNITAAGAPPAPWKVPYYTGVHSNATLQIFGPLRQRTGNDSNVISLENLDFAWYSSLDIDFALDHGLLAQSAGDTNGSFALMSAWYWAHISKAVFHVHCSNSKLTSFNDAHSVVLTNMEVLRQHYNLPPCSMAPRGDFTCTSFRCPTAFTHILYSVIINCVQLVFSAMLFYHVAWVGKTLRRYAFTRYRFANILLRLQLREAAVMFVAVTLSYMLVTYIRPSSCASQIITLLGIVPVQFMMTMMLFCRAWYSSPVVQDHVIAETQAQMFAFAEAQIPEVCVLREDKKEPMFCLETALLALFWSIAAYRQTMAAYANEQVFSKQNGLSLYGLTATHTITHKDEDMAVLAATGPDILIVSFRGTVSLKNVFTDACAWQTRHVRMRAPRRCWSTKASVHRGFWAGWESVRLEVQDLVIGIATQHQARGQHTPMRILFTGHSLGGALCSLAAYDVSLALVEAGLGKHTVQVYTFGAPRIGNHTFARLYKERVPDCFDIQNDQDVVPKASKWLRMYKRSGHRVIVNRSGHIIVRPTWLEINVLQSARSSVDDHFTGSYRASLAAIVLGQQDRNMALFEGPQGVRALWASPNGRKLMQWVLEINLDDQQAPVLPTTTLSATDQDVEQGPPHNRSSFDKAVHMLSNTVKDGMHGGTSAAQLDDAAVVDAPGHLHHNRASQTVEAIGTVPPALASYASKASRMGMFSSRRYDAKAALGASFRR